MKYITEGAKALHKSDLITLLKNGGVDIRQKQGLPKATLTAILQVLCRTEPNIAKSLSLDPQSVAKVQRFAGERKIGKLRLAKKLGFKPGNRNDDPKIAMLYRLLKVARKAKGEQDYSEIESVSQIQPRVSISTAYDSPEPAFLAENQRLSTAVHEPETSERPNSSLPSRPTHSRSLSAPAQVSCRDKCVLRFQKLKEKARRYGVSTADLIRRPYVYLKEKLCQLRERRRLQGQTTVIGRRQLEWLSERSKKIAIGAAIALTGGAVTYSVM